MVDKNKGRQEILVQFLAEVWSSGDIQKCGSFLAENYIIKHDPGDPWDGRTLDLAGFMERVSISRAPFPDQHFHVQEILNNEDALAVSWLWTATHLGDFPGFPATGKPLSMSGKTVYYFDEKDKIIGHWQVTDRIGIYQQLQQSKLSAKE